MGRKKTCSEMVDIEHVIILKTPFHFMAIEHLFPDLFNRQTTLVLYSPILDLKNCSCHKRELIDYGFSRKRIFKNPLKFIKPFRRNVGLIFIEIDDIKREYRFSSSCNWYLGSDKDIFTQILLEKSKEKQHTVAAIDEGLGFYMMLSAKDHIVSFFYKVLTPLLFGVRLYYIKRLGTLPAIDKVYVRHKKLVPEFIGNKHYHEFQLKSNQKSKKIPTGLVLFFSYPEQDFVLDPDKKIKMYVETAGHLKDVGRKLIIKPHPREDVQYLKNGLQGISNIEILQGNLLGEKLDYFDYELIVNVFSSVILDILDNKYPKERILTLGYFLSPPIKFDPLMVYVPLSKFNTTKHLNFDTRYNIK